MLVLAVLVFVAPRPLVTTLRMPRESVEGIRLESYFVRGKLQHFALHVFGPGGEYMGMDFRSDGLRDNALMVGKWREEGDRVHIKASKLIDVGRGPEWLTWNQGMLWKRLILVGPHGPRPLSEYEPLIRLWPSE